MQASLAFAAFRRKPPTDLANIIIEIIVTVLIRYFTILEYNMTNISNSLCFRVKVVGNYTNTVCLPVSITIFLRFKIYLPYSDWNYFYVW